MSLGGTAAYDGLSDLPPLVARAVDTARRENFATSCLPSHGRLLQLLAGGLLGGRIGETGTGCGVGLAWLASGAPKEAELFSIDNSPARVESARAVFASDRRVHLLEGDWSELVDAGPFDLLSLDGGGQGKNDPPIEPEKWLTSRGMLVIDDFTPASSWPPIFEGELDTARLHWLEHPGLHACEITTEPGAAAVVATRFPGIA